MSAATEYAPVALAPEPRRRPTHLHAVPDTALRPVPSVPSVPSARAEGLVAVRTLHAPADAAAAAPVRLTRRGVLALTALVAVAAGVLLWLAAASAPSASASSGSRAGVPAVVAVQPGDTLWSIATRVAPARDPRAEVDALRRANHLTDVTLVPGQQLRVP